MIYYYLFVVALASILIFSKRLPILGLSAVSVYFLVFFVEDEFIPPDYLNYLEVFNNAFTVEGWPFYKTFTMASVEELYVTINGFVKFNISNDFLDFIVIQAGLCLLLFYFTVKKMIVHHKAVSFVMLLPVIYPTINYFLLRSALPFFLGLLALIYLSKRRWFPAVLLFCIGFSIHSQYLFQFFLVIIAFFYIKKGIDNQKTKKINRVLVISAILLSGVLVFANVFEPIIAEVLSFLPNAGYTSTKLNYLDAEEQSYRITAILSIVIFPYFTYKILNHRLKNHSTCIFFEDKDKDLLFVYLLFALSLIGAAINIGFIDNSHVAGRLSRFSDYACTVFIIHTFLRLYVSKYVYKLIIVFIVLISPLIYPSVYMDIDWGSIF